MTERPLPPKIRRILDIAAEDHGVTVADILGRRRHRNTVAARAQAGATLLRMGYTLTEAGRYLGFTTRAYFTCGGRKARWLR